MLLKVRSLASFLCTNMLFWRHPDIPIPYALLLYIPLLVILTPNILKIKIEVSHMFGVFMLDIPIPNIYTGF